jgi:hypothetical protein
MLVCVYGRVEATLEAVCSAVAIGTATPSMGPHQPKRLGHGFSRWAKTRSRLCLSHAMSLLQRPLNLDLLPLWYLADTKLLLQHFAWRYTVVDLLEEAMRYKWSKQAYGSILSSSL